MNPVKNYVDRDQKTPDRIRRLMALHCVRAEYVGHVASIMRFKQSDEDRERVILSLARHQRGWFW